MGPTEQGSGRWGWVVLLAAVLALVVSGINACYSMQINRKGHDLRMYLAGTAASAITADDTMPFYTWIDRTDSVVQLLNDRAAREWGNPFMHPDSHNPPPPPPDW
jgi:hypothetical protein